MDEESLKVLEHIKKVGKTSGGKVQSELGISEGAYKRAKDALKGAGLVTLGRGRGGTIAAVEGATIPEEPKKATKAEVLEMAREEKQAKSRQQKEIELLRNAALEIAKKEHPDADKIEVQVWDIDSGKCYVYPWYGKVAQTHEVYI